MNSRFEILTLPEKALSVAILALSAYPMLRSGEQGLTGIWQMDGENIVRSVVWSWAGTIGLVGAGAYIDDAAYRHEAYDRYHTSQD